MTTTMSDLRVALERALPDALSAMTEGGEETMAPDPSDEPGSPYVLGLAELLSIALAEVPLDVERLAIVIHGEDPTSFGPTDVCGCREEAARMAADYAAVVLAEHSGPNR